MGLPLSGRLPAAAAVGSPLIQRVVSGEEPGSPAVVPSNPNSRQGREASPFRQGWDRIEGFGLIDASSIRRKQGLDRRLLWCEIKLSDWVFNAIRAQEVLTLHRDYFRLRKPIERRVYELARKHCGQRDSWRIGLLTLLKKTGSQSPKKRFRQMIRHLVEHDHLPDYFVEFDSEGDMVVFRNRNTMSQHEP